MKSLNYLKYHISYVTRYLHRLPKSKVLPRWLPLLYILLVFLKSRGGGKPVTGNVCTPAFGDGDGMLWLGARDLSPLLDAKGSRRLGGGKWGVLRGLVVLGGTSEESSTVDSGGYVPAESIWAAGIAA
jgi:hypothetical protein